MPSEAEIRLAIAALAEARAPRSICPSEVARALAEDWRPLMGPVREAAAAMQAEGTIAASQRGEPVDPLRAAGPIRLSLR